MILNFVVEDFQDEEALWVEKRHINRIGLGGRMSCCLYIVHSMIREMSSFKEEITL